MSKFSQYDFLHFYMVVQLILPVIKSFSLPCMLFQEDNLIYTSTVTQSTATYVTKMSFISTVVAIYWTFFLLCCSRFDQFTRPCLWNN